MPISRPALLYLVDYSIWADQQLLSACAALTPEEQSRDLGSSHTGISGTLRHIYDSEHFWLGQLRKGTLVPLSEFTNPKIYPPTPPEPDLTNLQQRWPEVWQGLHTYVATLPESDFALDLHAIDWTIPRWKLLLHVVNHATLHRGQVMSMFRRLGKQPPTNDIFIGYHLSHP
ncbi:MAG: DinB family protein [Acidobacteriaceae bacterium]